MMNRLLSICILVLIPLSFSVAATRTAVSSGNWGTNSTWNCNCQPSSSDNIIIPAGITVTVGFPGVDLTGGTIITITVNGTLRVSNASLLIDSNDIIVIASSGQVTSSGLGGFVFSGSGPIYVDPSTPLTGPSTITGGVLPVELLYFNVSVVSENIEVSWATSSEDGSDFFEVQRSTDGNEFKTLARINAAGSSKEKIQYNFRDSNPINGTAYYRLTQTDLDGSRQIFEIQRIEFNDLIREVSIYPNPVSNGLIRLDLNFNPSSNDKILITNSLGGVVYEQSVLQIENQFELPSTIGPGIYVVQVQFEDRLIKKRIIVR